MRDAQVYAEGMTLCRNRKQSYEADETSQAFVKADSRSGGDFPHPKKIQYATSLIIL